MTTLDQFYGQRHQPWGERPRNESSKPEAPPLAFANVESNRICGAFSVMSDGGYSNWPNVMSGTENQPETRRSKRQEVTQSARSTTPP